MKTALIFFGFVCFGFVTGIMVFSILLKWHIDAAKNEVDDTFFDHNDPNEVDIHHYIYDLINRHFQVLL